MADAPLYAIPDTLLEQYGLRAGASTARSYRCDADGAVLVAVDQVRSPAIAPGRRGYKLEKLQPILAGIAAGAALPPVPVYLEPGNPRPLLLDGAHRLGVSVALGLPEIPCRLVALDEAETVYRYPEGQL